MIWVIVFCILVAVIRIVQLYRWVFWQKRVIAWCDERELAMQPLIVAAKAARMGRMVSSQSSFRQMFTKFVDPKGIQPEKLVLSRTGVENAHHLLEQHEAVVAVNREITKEITDALSALTTWEAKHPVPPKPKWLW